MHAKLPKLELKKFHGNAIECHHNGGGGWPYERRKTNKVTYYNPRAEWAYLRELLHYIPWNCAFLEDDTNIIWSAWSDLLFTAIDECNP